MRQLKPIEDKVKKIEALLTVYRGTYQSDAVYLIQKRLEGDTPGIVLWMSEYDFHRLLIVANGSRCTVLEVGDNTIRTRRRGECPAGTEKFRYIVIS